MRHIKFENISRKPIKGKGCQWLNGNANQKDEHALMGTTEHARESVTYASTFFGDGYLPSLCPCFKYVQFVPS